MLHLVGTFVWLWVVDSLSSVDQEHRGHRNVVLSSDAPCPYTAHGTNISVLQRMGQERQLLRTIKERQTSFTGHIIRKGELEDLILAGKVQGKKARGGQRLLFLNQVMENTGLTSPRTIWDAARNRTLKIKISWVVKGHIDQGTEEREYAGHVIMDDSGMTQSTTRRPLWRETIYTQK